MYKLCGVLFLRRFAPAVGAWSAARPPAPPPDGSELRWDNDSESTFRGGANIGSSSFPAGGPLFKPAPLPRAVSPVPVPPIVTSAAVAFGADTPAASPPGADIP